MLLSKQLIHYSYRISNNLIIYPNSLIFYLFYSISFMSKTSLKKHQSLLQNFNLKTPTRMYINKYLLKLKLNTKYLFLLTIFIIYSKLNSFINSFFFKFNFLIKKQQKFTILRAPCNHKNSKEQFGLKTYTGLFVGKYPYLQNNLYNTFIILLLTKEKIIGLTKLKVLNQKNVS